MAKIKYELLKRDELLTASRLIQRSYNDLQNKNNRPTDDRNIDRASPFFYHLYDNDPDGCWAAYDGERLVGMGHALLRGKQWYLANFFVDPKSQSQGIGKELMKRCLDYGRGKVDSHALCTFSYNETSLSLYSKFAIMPVYPIFVMRRKINGKARISPTGLNVVEDKSNKAILRINGLEKRIRGYSRLVDLRYFAESQDYRIFQFFKNSRWVGYSAILKNSHIMPAGSPYPKYLPDILVESVRQCNNSKGKTIEINIGAGNAVLFHALKSRGFSLAEMEVFMSSKPYSDLTRYAPANLAMY